MGKTTSNGNFESSARKPSKMEKIQIRQKNPVKEKAIQPQPKSQPYNAIIVSQQTLEAQQKLEAVHNRSAMNKTIASYRKKGQKADDEERDDQRKFKRHQQANV